MNQATSNDAQDPAMDADNLYREETYTDRKIGTIHCLIPVTSNGADDNSRPTVYTGQTQIMTPAGALPINFELDAGNLADAVSKFADSTKEAIEQTMKELEEMRREAASQIVVPGADGGMGGMPGGGKIQMP